MPYPPLSLIKRLTLGIKMTPAQMDGNLTDIETGVNAQAAQLAVALNPNGTLKNDSVSTAALQDRVVTLRKLAFLSSFYAIDSGAANAMVISFNPALTGYVEGLDFLVKAAATNTGATTINVDSVGLIAVKTYATGVLVDLVQSQIVAGAIYELVYNGSVFVLLNPSVQSSGLGPVFFPAPLDLNPGGTVPAVLTDVDLSAQGVPNTAKAVILLCVSHVFGGTDGELLTEVKPDNTGSAFQTALQMGGAAVSATEASQQGIYPIGLVAGAAHIWFQITRNVGTCTGTGFVRLVGYIL